MAAKTRKLDFTNVKERSQINPLRQAEGDYLGRIESVEDYVSQKDDTNEMWLFIISTPEDNGRATYAYYCGFTEKQLFKIRNLFVAAGVPVPKKMANLNPNKIVGKDIGIALVDDEYEGKPKSTIDVVFPAADLPDNAGELRGDDDEEDEVEDEEEEIDLDTDDDEAEEEDEAEDIDEEDEEEEDEDEEEPPPAPKKKAAAKKKATVPARKKKAAKKPAEDDDEELDELDIEDL